MEGAPTAQRKRIAKIIRRIRLRLGETQKTFGKRHGVGQSIVSEWESGTRHPNRVALLQIAETSTPGEGEILLMAAQDARPEWGSQSGKRAPNIPLPLHDSIAPVAEGCNAG